MVIPTNFQTRFSNRACGNSSRLHNFSFVLNRGENGPICDTTEFQKSSHGIFHLSLPLFVTRVNTFSVWFSSHFVTNSCMQRIVCLLQIGHEIMEVIETHVFAFLSCLDLAI